MISLLLALATPVTADAAQRAATGALAQAQAWSRGDLEAALSAYCGRSDLTWVNKSGVSSGFEGFAASMREEFRDPSRMGKMETEVLASQLVGADAALIVIRWAITREGRRLMGGVSTQLWRPCNGGLRIVLEHAS